MHEAVLARAAMPPSVVCLGLLLRPYSIGHAVLLIRDNLIDAEPDLPHLAQAVLICCQSWRENERMQFDRWLNFKLWIWKRRIRRQMTEDRRQNPSSVLRPLSSELAVFRSYLEAGNAEFRISDAPRPEYSTSPRMPGSPFMLRLQQWLMTHFGLSEEAAWDYPLALAKMRWCAHWEQEGGLDIYNEHDAEFDRYVAEQEAKGAEALEVISNQKAGVISPEPDTSHNQPSAER